MYVSCMHACMYVRTYVPTYVCMLITAADFLDFCLVLALFQISCQNHTATYNPHSQVLAWDEAVTDHLVVEKHICHIKSNGLLRQQHCGA